MAEKETLLKMTEKMAEECRDFIIEWRRTNRAVAEPPLYDPLFNHLYTRFFWFSYGLYVTEILDDKTMADFVKLALPSFIEGSELPQTMPSEIADFIKTLNLDDFSGLPKEEA